MNKSHDLHQRPSALRMAGVCARSVDAAGLRVSELEDLALVRLHSLEDPPGPRLAALALPDQVGQVSQVNGECLAALCLAPGDWLLVALANGAPGGPADVAAGMQQKLASDLTAVCDQADALAGIRVSGPAAPWLLGKLSCLDFAHGTSAGAHCARTRMGDAAVIVHYHAMSLDAWVFDLYVDRSVARWLWELLTAAVPHAVELYEEFGAFA
jgi:heterotetrameric sarcosine oxidase gamma subunit